MSTATATTLARTGDDLADTLIAAVTAHPGREAGRYARTVHADKAIAGRTLLWLADNGYLSTTQGRGRRVFHPAR